MSFPIFRYGFALAPLALLSGCDMVVMNPSGDIASRQADLIIVSTLLMLIVIIPVIFLTFFFAWRYRKKAKARYEPEWDHSAKLELVVWGIPLLIIIALSAITWVTTHTLDPYRPLDRIDADTPLAADHKPLVVQVVSLDWKWLFFYPEQGVASVNELVTPVNTPIRFHITSSTIMNSFYIPALAGQIYAMPGMQTSLNAVMNEAGVYKGYSANYSGAGFSDMNFKYRAVSDGEFDAWIKKVKNSDRKLDRAEYGELVEPSEKVPVIYYSSAAPKLYHDILNRCYEEGKMCMDKMMVMGKNDAKMSDSTMKPEGSEREASDSVENTADDDE